MRLFALTLAVLSGCAGARSGNARQQPEPGRTEAWEAQGLLQSAVEGAAQDALVEALREEARAVRRAQRLLAWSEGTRGEAPPLEVPAPRPVARRELALLERAGRSPARSADERLALRLLRRSLLARAVGQATAPFDARLAEAERAAAAQLPFAPAPVAYRDLGLLLSSEPDPARRALLHEAQIGIVQGVLEPLYAQREQAAQDAARALGQPDLVSLAEELRGVRAEELLAEGARYVAQTTPLYLRALDRAAREELGAPREALQLRDLPRLFKAPRLQRLFPMEHEVEVLREFLRGVGLDLHTPAGGEVLIDDEPRPLKRPRAFTAAIDAPFDVRLSVKPSGGLSDYWTLFHEAGHAVHFASVAPQPRELVELGYAAPSEAYGELFRSAFADARWLRRFGALVAARGERAPTDGELASVLRRTALVEMAHLRRAAFAQLSYELRLHGRPASALQAAAPLLPDAPRALADGEAGLRELYRQAMGVALGVAVTERDALRARAEVDDLLATADYARCFALAGQLDEALRARFGEAWTSSPAVGPWLRRELFAHGRALTAEQVAERLGFGPRVDFRLAARRAERLLARADALEAGR